jgi:hypothetical protein
MQLESTMKYLFLLSLMCLFTWQASAQGIPGCTDPAASNYDANAQIDNGSCCYGNWVTFSSAGTPADGSDVSFSLNLTSFGLVDVLSFPGSYSFCIEDGCYELSGWPFLGQYSLTVTINGESAIYPISDHFFFYETLTFGDGGISGCADPSACNYDPNVTCHNAQTCTYNCYGCTDQQAVNYTEGATIDNGTCCYDVYNYYTVISSEPVWINAYSEFTQEYVTISTELQDGFCFESQCFQLSIYAFGVDSPYDLVIVNGLGEIVYSGTSTPTGSISITISEGGLNGCADPAACNYDPNVTCPDYYSCDYTCQGCTDSSAPNYNPEATIDNGTCCTEENWTTVTVTSSCHVSIFADNHSFNTYLFFQEGGTQGVCLPDGCFNIEIDATFDTAGTVTVVNGENTLFESAYTYFTYNQFSKNGTSGCIDPLACNYDPTSTCFDYSLCDYSCQGCTNPEAVNFDPEATVDNGTCCVQQIVVSTSIEQVYVNGYNPANSEFWYADFPGNDTLCINAGCYGVYLSSFDFTPFSFTISTLEGEILYSGTSDENGYGYASIGLSTITGCTDHGACNYNPAANCNDPLLCDYSCYGCTNPQALNYQPEATIDNGTCCVTNWFTVELPDNVYWTAYGNFSQSGGLTPANTGFCIEDGCFTFHAFSNGAFSGPFAATIYDSQGAIYWSGTSDEFGNVDVLFSEGEVFGCTDANACNYNPEATCTDWFNCDYSCYGCTDPAAPNYDATATVDDGSCCYNWNSVTLSEPGFWYAFSADGTVNAWGVYPDLTGFCGGNSCFLFTAYNNAFEQINFTITNANGEVYQAGQENYFHPGFVSVSLDGTVSGCTDPAACNYNPAADCNDGSCSYYCAGCLDPQALNFNPSAIFDDGTCFYSIETPGMQLFVDTDELNDQYYVRMEMVSLGNGAPYVVDNSANSAMMMVNAPGTYVMGPFSCDQDVTVSLNSMQLGMSDFMIADPIEGPCGIAASVEDAASNSALNVYPNPGNGVFNISGLTGNSTRITVTDLTGRTVAERTLNNASAVQEVALTDLTDGVYQMRIEQGEQVEVKKIVIRR